MKTKFNEGKKILNNAKERSRIKQKNLDKQEKKTRKYLMNTKNFNQGK